MLPNVPHPHLGRGVLQALSTLDQIPEEEAGDPSGTTEPDDGVIGVSVDQEASSPTAVRPEGLVICCCCCCTAG